ncbi:MAG: DUF3261 domain-containing protein, partial [Methylophaga sp.]
AGLLLSAAFISGCSLNPLQWNTHQDLLLLSPATGPEPILLKQKLTFIAGGKQQQFLLLTDIKADKFNVLVLMPTGMTVLKMSYDGAEFQQRNMTDITIPAEQIMTVMQFALWPEAALINRYAASDGWLLALDNMSRQLSENKRLRLDVQYKEDSVLIKNLRDHYQVQIQPLEGEGL